MSDEYILVYLLQGLYIALGSGDSIVISLPEVSMCPGVARTHFGDQ